MVKFWVLGSEKHWRLSMPLGFDFLFQQIKIVIFLFVLQAFTEGFVGFFV